MVFRLQIDGERENSDKFQINTIIKSIPKNVGRRKTFRSDDFFRNEINFYEHVIKACLEHQTKAAPSNVPKEKHFNEIPRYFLSLTIKNE